MNKDLHIYIDNEEVVCDKNITINEEMLSTSSTILKNCYPKSWETTKDYVSNFYFPKDYSKCKIFNEIYHPEIPGSTVSGSNLSINYDNTLNYEIEELKGNTQQDGTPTPDTPVPIQSVTGLQKVNVCGKNLFDKQEIIDNEAYLNKINVSNLTINNTGISWTATSNDSYIGLPATITGGYGMYIEVKENTTYTLSFNTNYELTNYVFYIKDDYSFIQRNVSLGHNSNVSFTTPENCKYIFIRFGAGNQNGNTINISNIQLELGSTATEYEPYKGNTYEVNLGKNLLDISDITTTSYITNNGNGSITLNGTGTGGISFSLSESFVLKANTTYTLSLTNTNSSYSNATFILRNGNTNIFQINYSQKSVSYTPTSDTTIDTLRIYAPNTITFNSFTFSVQLEKGSQATTYSEYFTPIELNKIGAYQDRIYKDNGKWYVEKQTKKLDMSTITSWGKNSAGNFYRTNFVNTYGLKIGKLYSNIFNYETSAWYGDYKIGITSSGNLWITTGDTTLSNMEDVPNWLSSKNAYLLGILTTPQVEVITNTDLINQLESIELLKGINNISVISPNEFGLLQIHYNYKEAYTTEDLIFCGLVKNTGNISLNPREPHYVDLQLLDFKDLLSTGETLNYVITGKTIVEAIEQVVASISDYGFIVGNINILRPDDIINAYSTLNKTAYDVFQYISDITQSKWFTRVIDENTIAIDFYDPTLMPQATTIEYTKEYFENNDIEDMTFNYSTNDYRNKQIMTSDEVYANITQTETLVSNGYQDSYMAQNKIGIITSITVNGVSKTFATKSEVELGASADFEYQPGEMTFTSNTTYNAGSIIIITYYPIVRGREIVLNNEETSRIQSQINRKGTISRYENRNDTTSSQELIKIGQSYIKYKGKAEITLKIITSKNLFNVGQIVEFDAPLEDLSNKYMVKSKTIEIITTIDKIFYTYELSSNFNSENAINYFDNQRAKSQGNIGEGETIARAIDIESTALIKFYDTTINEVEVSNPTSLDFALDGVLI